MLDELKLIIEAIAGLPTVMVWVLCGYLIYKLAVIGSVYGLIRLAINKAHEWLMRRNSVDIALLLDGVPFEDGTEGKKELLILLRRLAFIGRPGEYNANTIYTNYGLHYLRQAIERMEKDFGVASNPEMKE